MSRQWFPNGQNSPDGIPWGLKKRQEKSKQEALKKSRSKAASMGGKVRRLPSGLLDVSRKGKYTKLVEQNSTLPLLRLPAEIRNMIFELAIGGNTFEFQRGYPNTNRRGERVVWVVNKKPHCFGLMGTCRQIYYETAFLPFQVNTLTFSGWKPLEDLCSFLDHRLPVERRAITTLHIDCTHGFYWDEGWGHVPPQQLCNLRTVTLSKAAQAFYWFHHDVNDAVEHAKKAFPTAKVTLLDEKEDEA